MKRITVTAVLVDRAERRYKITQITNATRVGLAGATSENPNPEIRAGDTLNEEELDRAELCAPRNVTFVTKARIA